MKHQTAGDVDEICGCHRRELPGKARQRPFSHPVSEGLQFGKSTRIRIVKQGRRETSAEVDQIVAERFQRRRACERCEQFPELAMPLVRNQLPDHYAALRLAACVSLQPRSSAFGTRPITEKY